MKNLNQLISSASNEKSIQNMDKRIISLTRNKNLLDSRFYQYLLFSSASDVLADDKEEVKTR